MYSHTTIALLGHAARVHGFKMKSYDKKLYSRRCCAVQSDNLFSDICNRRCCAVSRHSSISSFLFLISYFLVRPFRATLDLHLVYHRFPFLVTPFSFPISHFLFPISSFPIPGFTSNRRKVIAWNSGRGAQ